MKRFLVDNTIDGCIAMVVEENIGVYSSGYVDAPNCAHACRVPLRGPGGNIMVDHGCFEQALAGVSPRVIPEIDFTCIPLSRNRRMRFGLGLLSTILAR